MLVRSFKEHEQEQYWVYRRQVRKFKFKCICTDQLQTRHNDYNYVNKPVVNKYLEKFSYKKIISNWNSLSIDLKSTAKYVEFYDLLKKTYVSSYSCEIECVGPCFSCSTI